MKTSVQAVDGRREAIPMREVVPFWFAVSSPLIGVVMGLLGVWFVTWLSGDKSQEVNPSAGHQERSDYATVNPAEVAILQAWDACEIEGKQ
jgi:hypothetical protein